MARFLISAVGMQREGLTVEYVDLHQDFRESGVQVQHSMFVPQNADYEDGVLAVIDSVMELLTDVLEDHMNTEPMKVSARQETDDDDDGSDDDDEADEDQPELEFE